jgi:Ca2+-binding RTX toxin-like protein
MVHTIGAGGITFNEEPGVDETVTVTGNSGLTVGGAIIADKVDASALTGATGLTMTVAMGNLANGATVLGSLTGKNTLQGSVFNDKITAGGAGDTLSGNAGSDTLTGGAGVDTFVQTAGATLTAGKGFTTATLTNGEIAQLTQPLAPLPTDPLSGPDIIQSFKATDRFQTGVAANYTLLTAGDAIAAGANFGIRGTYTAAGTGAGTFTVNIAAGNDLLVFTATGAGLDVAGNLGTNLSILQGGGALALTAANFVV